MSGVEILFAAAGFAFGLVQAYDSALRIVDKIKARRQARQNGLPPTDRLQESLARGKKAVEGAIESGTNQFADFAQGDLVVQNLLLKTTVQIQYVLLERLAAASEDDDVIDFEAVIRASDTAQAQAVGAIYQYITRKQHEEGQRLLKDRSHQWIDASIVSVTAVRSHTTDDNAANMPLRGQKQPLALQTAANDAVQTQTPIRAMTSSNLGQQRPTPAPRMAPSSHSADPVNATHLPTVRRRPTNGVSAQFPALDTQRRSETSFSSATGSSPSVSSPFSPMNNSRRTSYSSHDAASMRSVANSPAKLEDIHGGTCKYAEFIRNGDINKGMRREDRAPPYASHAKQDIHWCCKSSKCTFSGRGKQDNKKRWNVDDDVKNLGSVQYRFLFLAKSHVGKRPDQQSPITLYRCLICTILGHLDGEYSLDGLCLHLLSHCGHFVRGIRMEGPLRFVNDNVTNDGQFDIFLPRDVQVPTLSRRTTESTYVESDAYGVLEDEPVKTPPTHWSEEIDDNTRAWQS